MGPALAGPDGIFGIGDRQLLIVENGFGLGAEQGRRVLLATLEPAE